MEKSLTDAIAYRAWELDGKPSTDVQVYRDWTETVVAAGHELGWTFVPPDSRPVFNQATGEVA